MSITSKHEALVELLEGVDFSSFSMMHLIQRLERLRERPILVLPVTLTDPHLYGAWIRTIDYDCVCLDKNTVPVHQDHILCHEIGHMVLGHSTLFLPVRIGPYVETRSVHDLQHMLEQALNHDAALKRGELDSEVEGEAEAFATALQNELIRRIGLHALTHRVASSPVWSELAHGLGLDR